MLLMLFLAEKNLNHVRVDTMNSIDFVGPKAAHTTRKNIV
jgi:hypothetical protein